MYFIKVVSDFSAAHNLRGYQGRCENLHGHNWKVRVELSSSRLDELEMVCDFREVKSMLSEVLNKLDHAYLNDLDYFKQHNPTSERIAEYIFYELKKLIKDKKFSLAAVSVWETDGACAVFREG